MNGEGVEVEGIDIALSECDGDKAPGPDGFNFSFIKAGWYFPKKYFYEMFSKFHRRDRVNKELYATFLTLIPKISNPMELKDYRSISLVGCVYNLLSKVLENRLK